MLQRKSKPSSGLGILAGFSVFAGSTFINPWTSLDAVNIPRLIVILAVGSCSIFYILKIPPNGWATLLKLKPNVFVVFACSAFIISLGNAFFFSGTRLSSQLFGSQGRLTGFLPLVCLTFILILFTFRGHECGFKDFALAFYMSGLVNLVYGYIQFFKLDPVNWNNEFGPIVGTLGNPNFMSSFLGLFGVFIIFMLVTQFCNLRDFLLKKLSNFLLLLSILFLIQQTGSIQGFFVVLFGSAIILAEKFKSYVFKYRYFVLFVLILVLPTVFLGLAGYGPLGGHLYQSTLEVRFFYWRAAMRMIADKPLTGVGLDSFGDWYTLFRDEKSVAAHGTNLLTNSAHNIFLDMGAFGGLPLMMSYLAISLIITCVGFKYIFSRQLTPPLFNLTFAMWIGYLAQTLIGIHHLGLSLLGNLFGAIAFSIAIHNSVNKSDLFKLEFRQIGLLPTLASGLIGLVIAFPIARNDVDFRRAIYEREGQRIFEVVNRWPKNEFYLVVASRLFYLGNNPDVGRELAKSALETNPRSRDALKLLLKDDSLGESEKSEITRQLREIDPFSTD